MLKSSIGLLNSCTFNILVSNPEQDLEYIESMYCRPGRPVNVHVEYPDSAVLNGNSLLASSSMASLSALKTDQVPESQYLNKTKFQGLIINFSIDYQTDMTCVVNVILRGTTNVFTDVTAIVDSATTKDVKTDNSPITGAISIFDGIQKEFDSVIDKTKEKAANKIWLPEFISDSLRPSRIFKLFSCKLTLKIKQRRLSMYPSPPHCRPWCPL